MSGVRFKGASSIEDMLGWQKNSFNNSFKIADSGISEYTMEQIRAKAAVLDLNESLTTQAVSLAKDADFSAKAATGKLTFKKALDDNSISFSDFGDKLENNKLLTESQSKSLKGLAENLGRDSDNYKNYASTLINTNDELANSIISVETTSASSGKGLSSYFKGILATAKQLAPVLATIGVAFAAYKGFQFLDDKFTLTFSTAQKHMEESASAYESNYSELQSINSELETTSSRIAELKSQGTLTIAEEAELAKLERQNSLLEAQQKLKQGATDSAQKQAASDAATSINFKSEKSIQTRTDKNGMDMQVAIDRKQYVKEQVSMMQEAQRQIDEATDKINSGDKSKKWKKQLESAQNNLNEYKQNAMNTLSDLNSEAENLYDKNTGQVINGYESLVNEINGLNNLVNNFDLSPLEKNKATIDSFFDGSAGTNFLKDELIDVAKSGEITTDTLADMGLTLEDLGLSGKDGLSALNKYFKDLASSADEANSSVKEFDGSLQSITDASESENQDKNWNTVSDLFDKAKELDKNKKWGTDDFQSMAQFIAPESAQVKTNNVDLKAADYKNLWDQYKGNFEKYFDTDNPLQSAINAQDQLIKSGLGSMGLDGIVKWSDSFKSSADAAKAWGISVEAAEVAMRNLESYGAEFDGITFNAEELDNYKASLDGIKSIYDSMEDGAEKDRLGSLIEGWDAEYAKYEQDISTLSEDQVVKIKFEYDLAELQQKIQEARDTAESSDSNSDWAKVVAGQKQERSKLESQTGYTKESDSGYAASYDKLDSLRKERNKASGDAKTEITKEMSAIGDLQNAFQQFRLEGGNLNWEDYLKSDQATATLQDIMDSTQLTEEQIASLFGMKPEDMTFDIDADDSKAKNKLLGILSNDGKTIVMRVDANTEQVQAQIDTLKEGQTLIFTADVNGVDTQIKAVKDEDGTINYEANIDGVEVPGEIKEQDGEIVFIPDASAVEAEASKTDGGERKTKFNPDTKDVDAETSKTYGGERRTNYTANTSGLPTSFSPITRIVKYVATGAAAIGGTVSTGKNIVNQLKSNFYNGTLLSPAHAYGTARQLATQDLLAPAYVDGKVSLPNDEYALVNELGIESRIRNGVWSLLPPGMHMENLKKGDIILNAKQTSDLLKSGKTTGTARAYASGSLLTPAYASGMLSLGGSYGSSYGKSYGSTTTKSTKAKSSTNTASQAAQAATQVAEDLYDFVEILLDRTKELTEKLTDAIDDAVSLSDKMSKNSSALTQIQNEISVNQQAYQKYLAQANAVGLAEGYASQIRNGNLNIENITDENLKKKIDDYKKWYEEAKKCQDTIRDLQKDEKKLALDRLEYIESYYDAVIKLNEAYQDVNDARIEFNDAIGNTAIGKEVQDYLKSSYDKQYDSYNKALTQLSDYQNEFNELVRNGYINEGSEAWYEGQKTIQEFTKQVDESATALIELEDKIREIDYTRLQQIIDGSDRRTDQLKNAQSLAEARGEQIGRDEYQKQIDELSKSINANYALREAKIQEQNLYDVTSTRYQELAKEIADLDGQIYDDLVDIEDLKDQIFEAEFFNFDKEQESLEYFIGELDDFANLLNEEGYFDKNGAFTDEAYAKIALTAEAMAKCKQETANATEALKKLDEMYQNGLISETEYTERQRDLLDTIRDSVSATEDYKNELIDLYKKQIEESNDKLKENIKLRQDALKNARDYESFADSLKDKTKSVNELEAQINALQGVFALSILIAGTSYRKDEDNQQRSFLL